MATSPSFNEKLWRLQRQAEHDHEQLLRDLIPIMNVVHKQTEVCVGLAVCSVFNDEKLMMRRLALPDRNLTKLEVSVKRNFSDCYIAIEHKLTTIFNDAMAQHDNNGFWKLQQKQGHLYGRSPTRSYFESKFKSFQDFYKPHASNLHSGNYALREIPQMHLDLSDGIRHLAEAIDTIDAQLQQYLTVKGAKLDKILKTGGLVARLPAAAAVVLA